MSYQKTWRCDRCGAEQHVKLGGPDYGCAPSGWKLVAVVDHLGGRHAETTPPRESWDMCAACAEVVLAAIRPVDTRTQFKVADLGDPPGSGR